MRRKQSKLRNFHATTKHLIHFFAGVFTAPELENFQVQLPSPKSGGEAGAWATLRAMDSTYSAYTPHHEWAMEPWPVHSSVLPLEWGNNQFSCWLFSGEKFPPVPMRILNLFNWQKNDMEKKWTEFFFLHVQINGWDFRYISWYFFSHQNSS